MTPKQLRRAAFHLRLHASELKASMTIGGKWVLDTPSDIGAKREHDEMLALSRALYGMAREQVQPTKRKG